MTGLAWIVFVLVGVLALDRLAVWMEGRGWIYWRKKHGSTGTLGTAFLELQTIFEPSKRHVIEARREEDAEEDDSGDPPESDIYGSHGPQAQGCGQPDARSAAVFALSKPIARPRSCTPAEPFTPKA